jgi:hypothetical protein
MTQTNKSDENTIQIETRYKNGEEKRHSLPPQFLISTETEKQTDIF